MYGNEYKRHGIERGGGEGGYTQFRGIGREGRIGGILSIRNTLVERIYKSF